MITVYFQNMIANNIWHTEKENVYPIPSTYYLALSTTEPVDPDVGGQGATGVTEPNITPYKRVLITLSNAYSGTVKNNNECTWGPFTQDYTEGAVGYWAIFDQEAGGHLLMGGQLDTNKHIDTGTTLVLNAGSLSIDIAG